MDFTEIEIKGSLLEYSCPPGTPIGTKGSYLTGACTVAGDVLRQIDQAERDGIKAILLIVDCWGGHLESAYSLFRRLRAFSDAGGRVVSYVRRAASSAPHVALAGDYVVLSDEPAPRRSVTPCSVSPTGFFLIHSGEAGPGNDLSAVHQESAAVIASRTLMSVEEVVHLMSRGFLVLTSIEGQDAVAHGFADELGGLERARAMAVAPVLPETRRGRRLALAALAAVAPLAAGCGGDVFATADGIANNPAVVQPSPRVGADELEARAHEAAASNWSTLTLPTGLYFGLAASGAELVAVGQNAAAARSVDHGDTWSSATTAPPAGTYRAVAHNGSSIFAAVGDSNACASSPTGTTWTGRTIPAGSYYALTWSADLSLFVAVGANVCATSPDGQTWTSRTIPAGTYLGITSGAGILCAVGTDVAATSPDGINWTSQTIGTGTHRSVAYGLGGFVAVGNSGLIRASTDGGVTWAVQTGAGSVGLYGVHWDGYLYVVAGTDYVFTSHGADTWTPKVRSALVGTPAAIVSDGTRYVAVGGLFGQYAVGSSAF